MDGKLDTPRTDMARDEPRSVVPLVGLTLLAGVCNFVLLATMYKAFGDEYAAWHDTYKRISDFQTK